MIGHASSPTGIVHADMTLTRSKVKVTEPLSVHAGGEDRQLPCGAFWFYCQLHLHYIFIYCLQSCLFAFSA